MGPPSYMRSVVDRSIVMRRMTVYDMLICRFLIGVVTISKHKICDTKMRCALTVFLTHTAYAFLSRHNCVRPEDGLMWAETRRCRCGLTINSCVWRIFISKLTRCCEKWVQDGHCIHRPEWEGASYWTTPGFVHSLSLFSLRNNMLILSYFGGSGTCRSYGRVKPSFFSDCWSPAFYSRGLDLTAV